MNDSKIPVRYARALFDSAVEKMQLEQVFQDMLLISEICKVQEMREFLRSPIIVPSKKYEIIQKLTGGSVQKLTLSLFSLVIANGREIFIPAIAREFIRATKEHKGITESVLTTAVQTNENIKKQVTELIGGIFNTKVELKEVVDKEIIGGFILKIEDNYIDASIRSKLRKIEKELKEKSITI
jgi:F-type H+-transporting ATPase subunit delta